MIEVIPAEERAPRLAAAGFAAHDIERFLQAHHLCSTAFEARTGDVEAGLEADQSALQALCRQGWTMLGRLPAKSTRTAPEKAGGHALVHLMASASWRFFQRHATSIYRRLTDAGRRSLRVEALLEGAAQQLPGILPTEVELSLERERMQKDKDGLEINQGLFISQVLADQASGAHLIRSMLRPLPASVEHLERLRRTGKLDLGTVKIEIQGQAGYVTLHNERYLNSEDDTTVVPLEMAIDLVLLHPELRMGVLRGSVVDHPKYQGRRVFCSGINLTRIYQGKQSYLSFLLRNMAMHNKLYRGLLPTDTPDSLEAPLNQPEQTQEKPWVAVVEAFAIGGGCQLLLVVDYVIAEAGSYFSLPARKEGILPGSSNMRLPRFLGERLARQAIMFDKTFYADTPEGKLLANEVVPADEIDAVRNCVDNAIGSGMVSAGGNRRAMRVQTEPLDVFRSYLSTYAYEQAFCHLSEQLIENLERHWNAKARKL
jgi:thioesterase DpgC